MKTEAKIKLCNTGKTHKYTYTFYSLAIICKFILLT